MGKKKGKHVLMPPFDLSWPKINKDTENKIITALVLKLQEFPSLERKKTKDGEEKSGESAAIPQQKLNPQDEGKLKLKARFRQQVVIGFRQVSKAVERNQLALVLVSGDVQPPILLQSLFMLVASRKCAALCFPSLHPWLTDATCINSMSAVGFKKAQPDMPDDFGEFVSMAAALAPPLSLPGASLATRDSTGENEGDRTPAADGASSVEGMEEEGKSATETSAVARDWQVMEPEQEKEVIDKLVELFKPYKTIFQTPKSKLTPEDLQTRKTVNSQILTDLGAVRNATQSEQLDLILIQSECSAFPHPVVTSVVKAAAEKGCPTLHLASLSTELGAFIQGNYVRAVGFKKSQAGKAQQPEEIRQFIVTATQYVPSHLRTSSANSQSEDSSSGKKGENTTTGPPTKSRQKPPTPVYDVSNLYVYKKDDEDKTVPDSATEAERKSETYISLSGEPTVQYLGVQSLSDGVSLPGTAFVDCKSSGISGKTLKAEKCSKPQEAEQSMDDKSGTEFVGVMGLDVVDAPAVSKRPSFHESRGKKPKANLKRALDKSADRGEFVSFKVQRADVRVSVPNPNKKKKHKKLKKK